MGRHVGGAASRVMWSGLAGGGDWYRRATDDAGEPTDGPPRPLGGGWVRDLRTPGG